MTQQFERPKLDRRVAFDPRSRAYGISPYVAGTPLKKTLWEIPRQLPLNQGTEGACVGFGWSALLGVGPIFNVATNRFAQQFYEDARAEDKRNGVDFAEGASVLAGARVAKKRGLISGYKWAFGIQDVVNTICAKGPVVLGIPWFDGMYETDSRGLVSVNGSLVGGHCITATGYWPNHPVFGGNVIQWINSWGPGYGLRGIGYIREMELSYLLSQEGEAVIADEIAPIVPKTRIRRALAIAADWTRRD
jgi:hypothetical protein